MLCDEIHTISITDTNNFEDINRANALSSLLSYCKD